METNSYVLGIDIGTTSVKASIIDSTSHELVATNLLPSHANVSHGEQEVDKILRTVDNCISLFNHETLSKVARIGICGQMHGVCLWSKHVHSDNNATTQPFFLHSNKLHTSNLYTWMDQRCDKEFLNSLPKPNSHINISTGYGCATIFWLHKNTPEILQPFTFAGTIMDFIVAALTGNTSDKPLMTEQNAAFWGYFNSSTKEWNYDILRDVNFPIQFLPKISNPETFAGRLCSDWFGIKSGTPIGVALGDFQCQVLSAKLSSSSAFINISTSAQIGHIAPELEPCNLSSGIIYFPYFGNKYVATGASLNGGNVLDSFVELLKTWTQELGFGELEEDKIWKTILDAGQLVQTTDLQIIPTVFGERHSPNTLGSVHNMSAVNTSLGHVTRALCTGLLENLANFMPVTYLKEKGVTNMIITGSTFSRNLILRQECKKVFSDFNLTFINNIDAPFGAALAVAAINLT